MMNNALPAEWEGTWQGELSLVKSDNTTEIVTMRLIVEPVSETIYTWRIEYITDKQHSVRAYEIAPSETGRGHFIIDEKNGILLDCRLVGKVLFSQFQVQNALLHSRYEHQGDTIAMEIVSFDSAHPRSNVSDNVSDEEKIAVLSYPCRAYQQSLLRRL